MYGCALLSTHGNIFVVFGMVLSYSAPTTFVFRPWITSFERRLIGATLRDFYCLHFEAMSFCLLAICPLRVTGCVTSFGGVDNYLPFLCFNMYIVNLL